MKTAKTTRMSPRRSHDYKKTARLQNIAQKKHRIQLMLLSESPLDVNKMLIINPYV